MFDQRQYLIKEHVGLLKFNDTYDILDPATGRKLGIAKESTPGWCLALRLVVNKQMLPKTIAISEDGASTPALTIKRGFTFLRSTVWIHDGQMQRIGYFKSKLFSIGGGFWVHDMADNRIAEIKGDWKGWNFRFLDEGGRELGLVTKKWAGLGKELFTSADTYIVTIADTVAELGSYPSLFLAAGIAIDTIFKEKG
ncbi:MAG: oxidoreductase [Planctomycetes bacterium]|nr:oxidoreductase [Planctomycetota bacterium]